MSAAAYVAAFLCCAEWARLSIWRMRRSSRTQANGTESAKDSGSDSLRSQKWRAVAADGRAAAAKTACEKARAAAACCFLEGKMAA